MSKSCINGVYALISMTFTVDAPLLIAKIVPALAAVCIVYLQDSYMFFQCATAKDVITKKI